MLHTMLRDPKVETTHSIKAFQLKHDFSTENSLIILADTTDAVKKLFSGMAAGYYIFDKDGDQVCYNASAACQGVQFRQLLANNTDSFRSCKNDTVNLARILSRTCDLNGQPVEKAQLRPADYYVVAYWAKFLGGKRGYEDNIAWMEHEIKKSKPPPKFTFIKINTDLQERWGLIAGKKARLRWKAKGDLMTLEISDLPIRSK